MKPDLLCLSTYFCLKYSKSNESADFSISFFFFLGGCYLMIAKQQQEILKERHQFSFVLFSWIVLDEPRLPIAIAHVCHRCLKMFCYDHKGEKINNFKVYPFFDEFLSQQKKPHTNKVMM